MKTQQETNDQTSATCPACGLLCDDLILNQTSPLAVKNACPKGIEFFERSFSANINVSPSIDGKPSDLASAVKKATEILQQSKSALFAGLGTEVQGMRAVIRLAKKTNATLDHLHSDSSIRNTLALQNGGWLTTTLAEVKNRADVILAIGTDITSSHPRFFEKLVWNTESLFDKPTPEVIYIGAPAEKTKAGTAPDGKAPTTITADPNHLPEIVNTLSALLCKKKIHAQTAGSVALSELVSVVEKLKNAKYAVIVWSASSFKFSHAELTIQSIVQLINQLNETTRAAGLPLNSGDGDYSVNNASAWLSGYPTRSRFKNGRAEYDSFHFSTKKQHNIADALLWISTFNPHEPPISHCPTIVIGHPDTKFERTPDVFIPVGIPGVDHTGLMFRMDSSITLPLKSLQETQLPSLGEVIKQLETALSNTQAAKVKTA